MASAIGSYGADDLVIIAVAATVIWSATRTDTYEYR
jgi:hypothetical protein